VLRALITFAVIGAVVGLGPHVDAAPRHRLRLATVAPDGTHWARELRALAREVSDATHGDVEIKWYFGGIAGNEDELRARVAREQLDGIASGGPFCQAVSPTMRVLTMRGLFQTREEASQVMTRMKATLDEELAAAGFRFIGSTALGPELAFLRREARSWDELRKQRLWTWGDDPQLVAISRDIGLTVVAAPISDGFRIVESGQADGFITTPTALIANQWLPLVKSVVALPLSFSWGCLAITSRAFDRLPVEARDAVLAAAAKASLRIGEAGRRDDELLLGGVLAKSGVKVIQPTESMRAQFLAAARAAREKIAPTALSPERLRQVQTLLADFRAEHGGGR
jgi:TRAP-type C4-dicarboxylate transport system substrate-binding protein